MTDAAHAKDPAVADLKKQVEVLRGLVVDLAKDLQAELLERAKIASENAVLAHRVVVLEESRKEDAKTAAKLKESVDDLRNSLTKTSTLVGVGAAVISTAVTKAIGD